MALIQPARVVLAVLTVFAFQHQHPPGEQLGRVEFATSCRGVEAEFNRAVALLHSFSFSTANDAFQGVLAKAPACAIAYWGQALGHWGNPYGGVRSAAAIVRGQTAVEKGLATGTPTPRELAYLRAVAALYKDAGTVDQRTRILAYERAMADVARAYPDDMEAAIFHALAIDQTALPTDKTFAQKLRAAAILEPIFAKHPDHPGLAHYIIHANDAPPLAPRALEAARRYATIAPSAPHALHMPSHTFTRVGRWQESVDTNILSAAAAVRDGVHAEALHAMDYQVYAYLQMGMDRDARRLVDDAPGILAGLDTSAVGGAAPPLAGFYAAAAIPARYVMERGAWQDAAALATPATGTPQADALTHFARAIGAARAGAPARGRADLDQLEMLRARLVELNDAYWAEQVRIQREAAAAWIAFADGERTGAVARLTQAADAEDATDKSAVSPGPLAPAREQLGEMLLALDRPADALAAFEAVMKKEPGRFRAVYGAARAASLFGDRAKARARYQELLGIARTADAPGRPELDEARAYVR